jgi:hypothetical protein
MMSVCECRWKICFEDYWWYVILKYVDNYEYIDELDVNIDLMYVNIHYYTIWYYDNIYRVVLWLDCTNLIYCEYIDYINDLVSYYDDECILI